MNKQLFQCTECSELTPLIRKTEALGGGIKHEYAECQSCKAKFTFFYSDKELRNMLLKQQHTRNQKQKMTLTNEIQMRMDELKRKYEPTA